MLRGALERGDATQFRAGAPARVPGPGHGVPAGRLRVAVPHTHRHETRRHQDRQAGETDDPHRGLLRSLHGM